jgi:ABC-type transport system involved in cytochrome c biogenesis permease subunit
MTGGWHIFPMMAGVVVLLSASGAIVALLRKERSLWAILLSALGILTMATFIGLLWMTLERPPLRTMGETRLWYSFFLLLAGLFTYARWRYRWIMLFSTLLSTVFILINILKPEIHDQTLMPALQSGWFVPHVSVYMFSYALMGCATLLAIASLIRPNIDVDEAIERLLYGGLAFLSIGMLTGALWAKEAWGTYWNWDAKEAWAAATWSLYLIALHMAPSVMTHKSKKLYYIVIIVAFVALQMCWYGVNYLPSAADSVHTYNQ